MRAGDYREGESLLPYFLLTMITGNIYKQGEDHYLIWNFNSIDEQKALRRLLKDTDTRIGYRVTHFVTKVQPLAGQMTIDCYGV
jgi:hypothetical protein